MENKAADYDGFFHYVVILLRIRPNKAIGNDDGASRSAHWYTKINYTTTHGEFHAERLCMWHGLVLSPVARGFSRSAARERRRFRHSGLLYFVACLVPFCFGFDRFSIE